MEYARDAYVPDSYHLWAGLNVISGALERKVWLREDKIFIYPNTFVLLVGNPAVGKSTAITRAADLLEGMKKHYVPEFKIISGLMSQAGFCEEMNILSSMELGGEEVVYSSGYFYASEGSGSALNNFAGDFNSTITEFYDCADYYRKRLREKSYDIPRPCLNLIAGTTFEFLKKLVDQNSVLGGLASRFIYVIYKKPGLKRGETLLGSSSKKESGSTRNGLINDLACINKLKGEFKVERAALDLYDSWWNDKFVPDFHKIDSERVQSIMSRKPTLLKKVLMLLSVSGRDDLGITKDHMEKGIGIVTDVTKSNIDIIAESIMGNKFDQSAVTQFIMRAIRDNGGVISSKSLKGKFLNYGGDLNKFKNTIEMLCDSDKISIKSEGGMNEIRLLVNPDENI